MIRWLSPVVFSIALGGTPAAAGANLAQTEAVEVDVVVVGAGLSGLMAARTLLDEGVTSIAIVEASDRVGGRTLNQEIAPGVQVEAGGQWVGPTQTRILALAEELGVETFPTYLKGGARVHLFWKFAFTYEGMPPPSEALVTTLDELAAQVPLEAPWNAEHAAQWDNMSVAQWMEGSDLSRSDKNSLRDGLAATLAASPEEVSMLWWLFYINSAGGYVTLEGFEGGAQDSRIVGGSQVLATRMLEEFGDKVAVYFEHPVSRVDYDDEVTVSAGDKVFHTQRVILAMSPGSMNHISFKPQLPQERRDLQSNWGRGTGSKAHLLYERPFWRDEGLNGIALGFGPATLTLDNSPPDGSAGVLVMFLDDNPPGANAQERQQILAKALVPAFGEQALHPIGYVEKNWAHDPWAGSGCVSPNGPGVLTRWGRSLREPVGPVHFAGTETALVWNGYMEGAVRAGERAAREVARELCENC